MSNAISSTPEPEPNDRAAGSPRVTVVIPAFNVAPFIAETLDSVFAQTFRDFEVVLVNDGSADTTSLEQILSPYMNRLRYLKQENLGAAEARNAAIRAARGELLAFLDGDDIWLPQYLEAQCEFLDREGLDMVYSDALLFGKGPGEGSTHMTRSPSTGTPTFERLVDGSCHPITSGTVVRRQRIVEAGLFDKTLIRAQDAEMWMRLAFRGARIGYQSRVLLRYRMREGSLSGTAVNRVQREINVFTRIGETYELTSAQRDLIARELERLRAHLELEQGKFELLEGSAQRAIGHFERANRFLRTPKLAAVLRLGTLSPGLLRLCFRAFRRRG